MHRRDKRIDWVPILFAFLATVFLITIIITSHSDNSDTTKTFSPKANVGDTGSLQANISRLEIEPFFITNEGQLRPEVQYYYRGAGTSVYFEKNKIIYSKAYGSDETVTYSYIEEFANANQTTTVTAKKESEARVNYFLGSAEDWKTNIPTYQELVYENIYDGVDVQYRFSDSGIKSDIIVRADANPNIIRKKYTGITNISIAQNGDLVLETPVETFFSRKPHVYQIENDVEHIIDATYIIHENNEVGFALGPYDTAHDLIIDPILDHLVSATLFGGTATENSFNIQQNSSGNIYIAGVTTGALAETKSPAYDTDYNGDNDMFVAKLSNDLTTLLSATYIGGSGNDWGRVYPTDNSVYVLGFTASTDFPTSMTDYTTENGGGTSDMIIMKFNADIDTLAQSRYLGGNGEDVSHELLFLSDGSPVVVGYSASTNFTTTTGAYKGAVTGGYDGTLTVFSSDLTTITASTYIGGSGADIISDGVVIDNEIFIAGTTASTDLPTDGSSYQQSHGGATWDHFIEKVSSDLTTVTDATYLGGSADEFLFPFLATDNSSLVVHGITKSSDFPVTSGAYDETFNDTSGSDTYITILDNSLSNASASTYLGGSATDNPRAVIVDNDRIFVAGYTASTNFPTSSTGYDTVYNGGVSDMYITQFSTDLTSMTASTFFGGSLAEDQYMSLFVADDGSLYVLGSTKSSNIPTTAGAYQTTLSGTYDVFVARFYTALPNTPIITTSSTPTDGSGTISFTVDVNDADNENLKLLMSYSADACDGDTSGMATSTLGSIYSFSQTTGSETVSTASTSAWHIQNLSTASNTNTLQIAWDTQTDLPSADGWYCLFIKTNDSISNSSYASTTVFVDNTGPTEPGALSVNTTSTTSVVLNFGAASTDTNFSEYKIYYEATSSSVSLETGTSFTSSSDVNLATSTFNGATTTTISGLTPNTQYITNIWAYDTYGNTASSTEEVSWYTLANTPTSLVSASTDQTSLAVSWSANSSADGTQYYAENTTASTTSGWITDTSWTSTNLTCGETYTIIVKARNADNVETDTISVDITSAGCGGGGSGSSGTGNIIPDTEIILDKPTLLVPENNSAISTLPIDLSGTALPNASVSITVDNTIYTVFADAQGIFKTTILESLTKGTHTIVLKQTDESGHTSDLATYTFVYMPQTAQEHTDDETVLEQDDTHVDEDETREETTTNTENKTQKTTIKTTTKPTTGTGTTERDDATIDTVREIVAEALSREAYLMITAHQSIAFVKEQTNDIETTPGKSIDMLIRPREPAHSITARLYPGSTTDQETPRPLPQSLSLFDRVRTLFGIAPAYATDRANMPTWVEGHLFSFDPVINSFRGSINTQSLSKGTYTLVVSINGVDGSRTHITKPVVVLPQGMVTASTSCDVSGGVPHARIEIWKQTASGAFALWDAKLYGEKNPTITDEAGLYTLGLPSGAYYFHIEAPRMASLETAPTILQQATIVNETFVLEKQPDNIWNKILDWIKRVVFGGGCAMV